MTFSKPITVLLAALLAGPSGTPAPAQDHWAWPLSPKPEVVHTFNPPDKPWLSGHRGVDLGTAHDAGPPGHASGVTAQEVTAPADGVVTFAGVVVDRPVLTIDHGNGLRSSFEPLDSNLRPGDQVTKGQVIGSVPGGPTGSGHCADTCLHWGVRRGEEYINPLTLVEDLRPSILLPLE